jgi:hypothetical protein
MKGWASPLLFFIAALRGLVDLSQRHCWAREGTRALSFQPVKG